MAKNCQACQDLQNDAPNFVVNGLTATEIASLKNNTGLSPSNGNDDCEDLNNMNDCLIGNLADEVDAYDVCDWKPFTKNFVGNVWSVFGGVIAAICGLWTNIKNLWSKVNGYDTRIDDMCKLLEQVVSPSVPVWGTLPLANTPTLLARRCGSSTNKVSAQPGGGDAPESLKPMQNMGIYYSSQTVTSCSNGRQEMLEWICPSTYLYDLKSGVESGDILWKVTKADAQSVMGMSDFLWNTFAEEGWTWRATGLGNRQIAWLRVEVGKNGLASNEMGVIFLGCSAPNDPITNDTPMSPLGASACKVYRHYL